MPFKKGQSGNPGGRPKMPKELKEAAQSHTKEALKVLVDVMKDKKAPQSARVSAANSVLDRGWGKSESMTKADVNVSGSVEHKHMQHSEAVSIAQAALEDFAAGGDAGEDESPLLN